jgi:hypothetical protein
MLRFELTITGDQEVINRLRTAAAKGPSAFDEVSYRFAQNMRAKLKSTPYPAKRPGQRYARTGRLANSWRAERLGNGRALIANSAGYSGYVVGKKQAWFHRGRWWTARSVIEQSAPELRAAAIKELDRLLK